MKQLYKILISASAAFTIASCQPKGFVYAPAKITTAGNRIHIEATGKFRSLPDTTIYAVIIRRQR